jgi:hypothetical protein
MGPNTQNDDLIENGSSNFIRFKKFTETISLQRTALVVSSGK